MRPAMRFCATLWIATGACALRATRRGAIDFAKNSAAAAATAGVAVAAPRRAAAAVAGAIVSDEVAVTFQEASVGLQLEAIGFAKATLGSMPSFRVAVVGARPGSEAAKAGVESDWVVVAVDGENVEKATLQDIAAKLQQAPRPTTVVFRDPSRFAQALEAGSGARGAATTILPPSGPYTTAQTLVVERLNSPVVCGRGAERGDLLEIRYEGRLAADGRLFDGSAITFAGGNQVAGRGGDSTVYFVLGQQPLGQFPAAWDPALGGACVGEVRRVSVPPVLGFGDKGAPKRNVPPYAMLDYTLQLVSINSNAQPR
ncbi:peptidyl-prolyl cis-trans isomerase [Aureococcus anophagefferens]|uniref:peptidylprolyl isomerase n=2 Tax=Aureococcus anophagefferens TaxID=44056 RepID=A0ABR1FY61_AURAN